MLTHESVGRKKTAKGSGLGQKTDQGPHKRHHPMQDPVDHSSMAPQTLPILAKLFNNRANDQASIPEPAPIISLLADYRLLILSRDPQTRHTLGQLPSITGRACMGGLAPSRQAALTIMRCDCFGLVQDALQLDGTFRRGAGSVGVARVEAAILACRSLQMMHGGLSPSLVCLCVELFTDLHPEMSASSPLLVALYIIWTNSRP